jgi:hypothetical protein
VRKENLGAILILMAIGLCPAAAKPRLFPPSAFPELPPAVMQALQTRGCQIPQIQRRKRDNVIQGSFFKSGQTDWAVLCTTKNLTELLVFENGAADQVVVIASFSNGFVKLAISPMAAHDFPQEWLPKDGSLQLDHDGISSFAEFGYRQDGCLYCYSADGNVLYFDHGQWIKVSGVIVN